MTRRRALLAGALLGSLPAAAVATPGEVPVGSILRDAAMQGLNGPSRRLSSYRGRPLIINVWASWCGPCRAEMASLERLAWHDLAKSFSIIGISTDDHVHLAMAALKASNATINHFIDRQLELEHMLGAARIPLTLLVDAEGRVLEKIQGAREWDSPETLRMIAQTFGAATRSTAK